MDWGSASAAQTDVDPPSLIGTLVAGKFRVDKLLGSGSTGDVYLSTHIGLEKVVALKVLHADMVKHENFVERFKREARAASRLEHPNSVRVLDFGEDPNGVLYIAMEYIDGRDLWSLLDEEWPLDNARIVDIMSQVLAALSKAHSLGIVHRDLKPENIMVRRSAHEDGEREGPFEKDGKDVVTVCDFGIAQLSPINLSGSAQQPPTVTGEGMVVGTPAYMSPEQARAEPLDARSDVYSAGVVLFQMLTRQLPFTAETPLAVAVMHCSSPPPTPSQLALVHPALESVCLRALCKAKEARYQSARDMQIALQDAIAQTNAQLVARPKKRRPYALPAPPLALPPPRQPGQPRQQSPASLAPFELNAEPEQTQPPKSGRKGAAVATIFLCATLGISAITLWGAGSHDTESASPKPSHVSSLHMDEPPQADAPPALPPVAQLPIVQAPAVRAEPIAPPPAAPEPLVFSRPDPQPEALTAAATRGQPQQNRRADRDPQPARGVRVPPPDRDKDDKRARPVPVASGSNNRRQTLSAEDFETEDFDAPRLTVTPAPSQQNLEAPKPKAAASEASPKPAAATADSPQVQEVVRSEPEIPVGLVELPSRSRVIVSPEPTTRAALATASAAPASSSGGSYDRPQVHFVSITTQAAVSKASIRNALNESALKRCYSEALRAGAAGPAPLTAQLEMTTNMGGRIASASVLSGLPKSLGSCVEQVARSGRVREVDTGTAKAIIILEFTPQ